MDTGNKRDVPIDHDDVSAGKLAAEGVGGAAAGAAGAAIGAMAGPVGMIVGGLAGIVGGWWAGKAASESARHYTPDDDRYYREAYEASPSRIADRSFDDIRPAYQVGHLAGRNPDYKGRDWDAVERDLEQGWTNTARERHGEWDAASPFARDAFTRSRTTTGESTAAGAERDVERKIAEVKPPSDLRPDT
ncbi:MAG TPA: hypothetical protein VNC18_12660 [Gemmatimonadaceae bacterium]|jgi:hypothetical protein|nr:hypothetical protein [Gemmatimonadaceae bacterium]